MEKNEARWLIGFAAMVMLFTSVPYLLGYAVQGADWRFTGFVWGVEDGNSYIAKMLAGAAGDWLFRTPYTSLPQSGAVILLPYLWLGKLASPPNTHDQLVALFHLYRFAAGCLAILATYAFLARFLRDVRLRRWGTLLASLGGSLAWMLVLSRRTELLGSLPLDYISPESFGFLELYGLPHLALARAGLLGGLALYLQPYLAGGEREYVAPSRRATLGLAAIGLVTFLAQPLSAVLLWLVIGLHQICLALLQLRARTSARADFWRPAWARLRPPLLAGLASLPLFVYSLVAARTDTFLLAWGEQNNILSPHPLHYLLAYGPLIPLAIAGGLRLVRGFPRAGWLPAAWVLAVPVLVYSPVALQRRLAEGAWVALIALALAYFDQRPAEARERLRFEWFRPAALLLFPTTLILLASGIFAVQQPAPIQFRPAAEVGAFEALATRAACGSVVLSAYDTGNALPAWAPVRVVLGHSVESVQYAQVTARVASVFAAATPDPARLAILQGYGVDYVFWGPQERALGGWDPNQAGYLQRIYQNGDYQLFSFQGGRP